jgi:hypothetical protein
MPTLEELLRASLKGADEKLNQARSDLGAAVVEAAKAVEAVTAGKATIRYRIQKRTHHERGDFFDYEIGIVTRSGEQFRALVDIAVPVNGYPIFVHDPAGVEERRINSPDELTAFFHELASESDSPLVAHLAFINRNSHEDLLEDG